MSIDPKLIFKAFNAVPGEHRSCVRWVVSPAFHRALWDSEDGRRRELSNPWFTYRCDPYDAAQPWQLLGRPGRIEEQAEDFRIELTCEERETRRRIANELRQSATTIMEPLAAKLYREMADHIEAGRP